MKEPVLFSDTIWENIIYGSPQPEHASDSEVYEACRKANAYNFIKVFPDEIDTMLGEKGANLSGYLHDSAGSPDCYDELEISVQFEYKLYSYIL